MSQTWLPHAFISVALPQAAGLLITQARLPLHAALLNHAMGQTWRCKQLCPECHKQPACLSAAQARKARPQQTLRDTQTHAQEPLTPLPLHHRFLDGCSLIGFLSRMRGSSTPPPWASHVIYPCPSVGLLHYQCKSSPV